MSSRSSGLAALAGLIVLPALALAAGAQAAPPQFSAAQVDDGRALYARTCAVCHGDRLEGGAGPSLLADAADGPSIAEVYVTVSRRMPKTKPGSLSEREATALLAFLLASNGHPAGPQALTAKDAAKLTQPYARPATRP